MSMNDIERYNFWHREMDAYLRSINKKVVVAVEEEDEPVGHICRYCGHVEMQINNHFAHIEFCHPDKPLI